MSSEILKVKTIPEEKLTTNNQKIFADKDKESCKKIYKKNNCSYHTNQEREEKRKTLFNF